MIFALNIPFDYYGVSFNFRLVLQAADRGSPSLSATSIVTVLVADINDNAPTIPPLETVYIHEGNIMKKHIDYPLNMFIVKQELFTISDASPGYTVMCLTANDVDLGPNVSYSFTEDGNPDMKFDIDFYTGVITLTELLDFEETSQHQLRIQASDSLHQTEAKLTVKVVDVNDNPPLFTKDCYKVSMRNFKYQYAKI